ncbi:cytochrome b/b6 domain-containing protein [Pseudohongiella spirulinae]|uniref:Cytochrome B561 n=1 Tax=Pseudohongiella spirulinae TaxID=1249552 RepID=A0A0S2KEU2_9GAMM|nr:cytochrome b/b6 domain-containing protein [Pseudohongiella spirulinae]ALO46860.1 cytochrome B561 [Pseudohongiella spirulinae]
MTTENRLYEEKVWDRSIRIFHWVNVLCVLALMIIGSTILYANLLGISSEGKITLKIMHAYVGYVFAFNLLWRLVWGFVGSSTARWGAVMPFRRAYPGELKEWLRGIRTGQAPEYRGHNPAAKLMLLALYVLLVGQMTTGLVLAGTDLYFPPFGHEFAEWATGAGEDHSQLVGLVPGAKEMLDPEGYAAMRQFREPFIYIHKLFFWVMLVAVFLHVLAVVVEEIRHGNGLVSAMISGKKVFRQPPRN